MVNYASLFFWWVLIPHFNVTMDNTSQAIDSFAQKYYLKLLKEKDPVAIQTYEKYRRFQLNPSYIRTITCEIITTAENSALCYQATLDGEHKVTGFHFTAGPYKNEIWAQLWLTCMGIEFDPLPIPRINYDIIKKFYEKTKSS